MGGIKPGAISFAEPVVDLQGIGGFWLVGAGADCQYLVLKSAGQGFYPGLVFVAGQKGRARSQIRRHFGITVFSLLDQLPIFGFGHFRC